MALCKINTGRKHGFYLFKDNKYTSYGIKRVVVTGLGALTPIGNNIQEYWNALINGVSGAALITYFDSKQI
jgi:3-oxoacyl-[acyl-carrier-protein] synthase II